VRGGGTYLQLKVWVRVKGENKSRQETVNNEYENNKINKIFLPFLRDNHAIQLHTVFSENNRN
jgi:hypothetical protein